MPAQLGTWAAREEARKFWDHFVCNKCVYFAKPSNIDTEVPHVFAEKYVRNDLWFHIRWTQIEPGQTRNHRYEALIEGIHLDESFPVAPKLDHPVTAVDGKRSVFVEVPELIELPEMMRIYGIRSVVRLKRVEDGVDARVKQIPFLPVGLVGAANRKDNLCGDLLSRRNCLREQVDQVPRQLIERGAETVNEIGDGEGDFFVGGSLPSNYEKVLRSLRIVFFDDRIRVAFNPISKLLLSKLEVKVSPSGFHVDVLN